MRLVVDVYAARTLDLWGDTWSQGGPFVFIREALIESGLARVRRGCLSTGAVFAHRELRGKRSSHILSAPSPCRGAGMGDVAVVAPVFREMSVEYAKSIVRLGYRSVVFDLQGFLRTSAGGIVESLGFLADELSAYLEEGMHEGIAIRASWEDLGGPSPFTRFMSRGRARVTTLGPWGACGRHRGQCIYCRPEPVLEDVPATGAGDVFNAFLAVSLAEGYRFMDALCRSVKLTARYLYKRAGLSFEPDTVGPFFLPSCDCCLTVIASTA